MRLIIEKEFRSAVLQEVEPVEGGWWLRADGIALFCPNTACAEQPQPGEEIKVFPPQAGRVRGIIVGDRVYFYHSEEEDRRAQEQEREERTALRQLKLEETRADRDSRIAHLDPLLVARIYRFQRVLPHWRRDFEEYELFVCEEAMKTQAAVRARYASPEAQALDALAARCGDLRPALRKHFRVGLPARVGPDD